MVYNKFLFLLLLLMLAIHLSACAKNENGAKVSAVKIPDVPSSYSDKHMPAGWWTDDKVIAVGQELYTGAKKYDVNCANCHGFDGIPILAGARSFRDSSVVNKWSDSYWFWRISEGVPGTAMKSWKDSLSEEERWEIIAYAHTLSHDENREEHKR